MSVGQSVRRVDAFDKVTGRAKYTDDLCGRDALVAHILHSTIAHGFVKKLDTAEAAAVPGVVKILTCFDVPDIPFPTAGHPWSTDPGHRDVADRHLLNRHVRYYGDDIACVIAENDIAAKRALALLRPEYEELPFVLDPEEAMRDGAPLLHEAFPNNILKHTGFTTGEFDEAIKEDGLVHVSGTYQTPIVQHCHIENHICTARMESGKLVVVSSTQIPHIVRRIVGQALGMPWGNVRIIKPYIGGGFGNKQDALYEPLCAFCSLQAGGRLVKLDVSREETFVSNRTRHSIRFTLDTWARPDGRVVARSIRIVSAQGAYASHGHSIAAKCGTAFKTLYSDEKANRADIYTVYTNTPVAGAMRGYGVPQITFAMESHADDVAKALGVSPLEFRALNRIRVGFHDAFYGYSYDTDRLQKCIDKGRAYLDYDRKLAEYAHEDGPVRRGVGMAMFWYNTGVWPISLESSSCRMVVNQDGSLQVQLGETEIGQGADTAFTQMTADAVGVSFEAVHVISTQDTDLTPFGLGAYASRQTYVAGQAIHDCGTKLKRQLLTYAAAHYGIPEESLDLKNGMIIDTCAGKDVAPLGEMTTEALYSLTASRHFSAECTHQITSNALSLGCCFAEVTVDIPLCKVRIDRIINVHDCGTLINPQLAEAQVHGGMSMAIGYALSEELKLDPKTGRVLNDNLLDYKLSTTMDHPHLEAQFVETPEKSSPYGNSALGEPPAVPCAPAIRNAILQATGVALDRTPMTPHVLFEAFRNAGLL